MVLGWVDNMSLDNLTVSTDGGNGVSNSMYFSYNGVLTEGEAMNLQISLSKDRYDDNKYEIAAEEFGQSNWKKWHSKFKKEGLM